MSDHDIAIGPVGVPNVAALTKKPPHLVLLIDGKKVQNFLSMDKPEAVAGFIQVKGFFVEPTWEASEDSSDKYIALIGSTSKDKYVEMYFPLHRVHSVKNLMFKAKTN